MRRKTNSVRIGNITLSSEQPVLVQSMLNTPTMDTEACVEQAIRIIEAGGKLVRITAPGVKEALKLEEIHAGLRRRGYDTPLSADIHFTPEAALVAARYVEKVRINPGNFVDKRATFRQLSYTEEEYAAELKVLREKFTRFLEVCRENRVAVRIGTNHGSLSDRIMSRYGDTPAGMVEATMEYLRICRDEDFRDVVISLKSSDCRVMVDAVRLLTAEMEKEEMYYPLHLGVTEAGEGEDGRIRSAVGIGTLLNEGIGDTIRVSLTEPPEAEIPVAKALVAICNRPVFQKGQPVLKGEYNKPLVLADLSRWSLADDEVIRQLDFLPVTENGETSAPRLKAGMRAPEMIFTETLEPELADLPAETVVLVPMPVFEPARDYHPNSYPLLSTEEFMKNPGRTERSPVYVRCIGVEELSPDLAWLLRQRPEVVLLLSGVPEYGVFREFFRKMADYDLKNRVILHATLTDTIRETISLRAASQLGGFFLDRLADGIALTTPAIPEAGYAPALCRNILQSAGVRRYKAEFISCPGCGRTQFDLQGAVAKVKAAFSHLSTLKIAVMGCVVNGPGEMGDADYGYVGAGSGKVNLYKGRKMVCAAVPEEKAIEALKELIEGETC